MLFDSFACCGKLVDQWERNRSLVELVTMPDFKRFDLCREDHLDLFTTRHCGLKNLPHNYLKPGSAAVGAGSVEVKIPNFCVPYSKTPLVEEVMIESSISPPAVRLKDIAVGVVALSEAARPQSTCKRVQPNSRAGRIGFMGVRTRKGVRGYLVEIRPPKWKRTIWLGTYKTAEEAACAYDAGVFYTRKKTKHNFPELEATFPPLPCHLRFDSADDLEEIKLFVQKQARQVTLFARNRRLSPTQIVTNSKQILEGELAAIAIAGESDPRDLGKTQHPTLQLGHWKIPIFSPRTVFRFGCVRPFILRRRSKLNSGFFVPSCSVYSS